MAKQTKEDSIFVLARNLPILNTLFTYHGNLTHGSNILVIKSYIFFSTLISIIFFTQTYYFMLSIRKCVFQNIYLS